MRMTRRKRTIGSHSNWRFAWPKHNTGKTDFAPIERAVGIYSRFETKARPPGSDNTFRPIIKRTRNIAFMAALAGVRFINLYGTSVIGRSRPPRRTDRCWGRLVAIPGPATTHMPRPFSKRPDSGRNGQGQPRSCRKCSDCQGLPALPGDLGPVNAIRVGRVAAQDRDPAGLGHSKAELRNAATWDFGRNPKGRNYCFRNPALPLACCSTGTRRSGRLVLPENSLRRAHAGRVSWP